MAQRSLKRKVPPDDTLLRDLLTWEPSDTDSCSGAETEMMGTTSASCSDAACSAFPSSASGSGLGISQAISAETTTKENEATPESPDTEPVVAQGVEADSVSDSDGVNDSSSSSSTTSTAAASWVEGEIVETDSETEETVTRQRQRTVIVTQKAKPKIRHQLQPVVRHPNPALDRYCARLDQEEDEAGGKKNNKPNQTIHHHSSWIISDVFFWTCYLLPVTAPTYSCKTKANNASSSQALEAVPQPRTPRLWRIGRRILSLRYWNWKWDNGKHLDKPPVAWSDWYLQNEGRGLLTLISEPDFKLKDVLPNWQGDGHFWWFIDHNN